MPNKLNIKHENIAGSEFEDLNLSGSRFENINLSGTRFHDINFSDVEISAANMGGARFKHLGPPPGKGGTHEKHRPVTFEDAALCDSTFRNVNLSNVRLNDCNIEGMTIDGVLVSDMLEAYLAKIA
jgi:uncharacterized protein YjbI with pentapeptide repeats